ncbi:NUDIX domain-containing protein [Streptomyces sp. NPDC003642]
MNASAIIHDGQGRYLLYLRDANKPWIWEPGCWSLLGGGREPQDRTLLDTVRRELREEAGLVIAGLVIDPADVDLVHVVHMRERPADPPRIQLFFRARRWQGTPQLREPNKCVAWRWWSVEALPEPIVAYARTAIEGIQTGRRLYTELGWQR